MLLISEKITMKWLRSRQPLLSWIANSLQWPYMCFKSKIVNHGNSTVNIIAHYIDSTHFHVGHIFVVKIASLEQNNITLHYRHFKRHLHLKWPVVHQQLHVIRNTAHRPSTQASYTCSKSGTTKKDWFMDIIIMLCELLYPWMNCVFYEYHIDPHFAVHKNKIRRNLEWSDLYCHPVTSGQKS